MPSRLPEDRLPLSDRLIVALDVSTAREAQLLSARIGEAAGYVKVGLQLFVSQGPALVRELLSSGRRVFLDLKLHDIPNTVSHAVQSARELGVQMLTVHASGGEKMLRAAVEAAAGRLDILAVTVLTSLNDAALEETGVAGTASDQVLRLGSLALTTGCPGLVTSAHEVAALRQRLGDGFKIVVPGIRPEGSQRNDQERISTPAAAVQAGATHLVVGRPVTQAADPAAAARRILDEITQAATQVTFQG